MPRSRGNCIQRCWMKRVRLITLPSLRGQLRSTLTFPSLPPSLPLSLLSFSFFFLLEVRSSTFSLHILFDARKMLAEKVFTGGDIQPFPFELRRETPCKTPLLILRYKWSKNCFSLSSPFLRDSYFFPKFCLSSFFSLSLSLYSCSRAGLFYHRVDGDSSCF